MQLVKASFAKTVGLFALQSLSLVGDGSAGQVCGTNQALYCGPDNPSHSNRDGKYLFQSAVISSGFQPHGSHAPADLADSDCTRYSGCGSPGSGFGCYAWSVGSNGHTISIRAWAKANGAAVTYRPCSVLAVPDTYDCQCV